MNIKIKERACKLASSSCQMYRLNKTCNVRNITHLTYILQKDFTEYLDFASYLDFIMIRFFMNVVF